MATQPKRSPMIVTLFEVVVVVGTLVFLLWVFIRDL